MKNYARITYLWLFVMLFIALVCGGCSSIVARTATNQYDDHRFGKGIVCCMDQVKTELATPNSGGAFFIPTVDFIPTVAVEVGPLLVYDIGKYWHEKINK